VAFENIQRDQLADRGRGSFYRNVEIQPIKEIPAEFAEH
jgi:hypothetical protein